MSATSEDNYSESASSHEPIVHTNFVAIKVTLVYLHNKYIILQTRSTEAFYCGKLILICIKHVPFYQLLEQELGHRQLVGTLQ